MFNKEYVITVVSQQAIKLANLMSDLGMRFYIEDEYLDYTDPERRWFRRVRVYATKGQMRRMIERTNMIDKYRF